MYTYIYRANLCMCARVCYCVYVCVFVCVSVYVRVYIYTYRYRYIPICTERTCVFVCVYACVCVCVCVYVCVYVHIHMYTDKHIYIYIQSVLCVNSHEFACPNGSLVSACARSDFNHYIAVVVRVLQHRHKGSVGQWKPRRSMASRRWGDGH